MKGVMFEGIFSQSLTRTQRLTQSRERRVFAYFIVKYTVTRPDGLFSPQCAV